MSTWALVPLKAFHEGKRRLDGHLGANERALLVERMAAHVVATLRSIGPRLAGVAVVSPDEDVRRWAVEQGARAVEDSGDDLNAALLDGLRFLQDLGARSLLVVPADLPDLDAIDVRALLDRNAAGRVTVVRAHRDGGTNALLLPLPTRFEFVFGPDSAERHRASALRAGLQPDLICLSSLDHDLDVSEDLQRLDASRA